MLLYSFLLLTFARVNAIGSSDGQQHRCRTTEDLGRIPWFLPNSTFHNFGFPLIRTLCKSADPNNGVYDALNCVNATDIDYLYESTPDLRSSGKSSTVIVDPHMMEGPNSASSGTYVIMAMFEFLFDLGYQPGVRHWSEPMNGMFPAHIAAAASDISRRYEAFVQGKEGANPFASTYSHIMLQIEVPFGFVTTVPVNPSPYVRTYKYIIGMHQSHNYGLYHAGDPAAHCAGANFHLSRGRMCSTSGVIPCPQYDFHRTRSLEVTPETRKTMKKNIILFDNDQEEFNMNRLRADVMRLGGLNDLQVLLNKGRKKTDMPDLYKQVKMTIDCRNPGVEFINYEATLYDVMTLSCDMRATRNVFDFPVPSKYHINPSNWTHLVLLVHDLMLNYEKRIDDFKHFKRLSRTSTQMAKTQVDIHYFSRDVMFRTHCTSYAECRRVYPWAVAVWTLYPLAMIEVVTDVDMTQELLDSDLVRITLSDLINSKFFRMFNSVPGVAPVDMFPQAPCAYMVYMDASFIPFGRDFLNTHVSALVKDPRPILYWQGDKKLAIAVMHARSYAKVLRAPGNTKVFYIESDNVLHQVSNPSVQSEMLRLFGAGAETLEAGYLTRVPNGAPFTSEDLHALIRMNPPLLTRPCDASALTPNTASAAESSVATTSLRRRATSVTSTVHRQQPPPPRVAPATSASTHHAVHRSQLYPAASQNHPHPNTEYVHTNPNRVVAPSPLAEASPIPEQGAPVPVVSEDVRAAQTQHPHQHQHQQHQHDHQHQHHDRDSSAFRYRCTPPENLIIDAVYVPMPRVGGYTKDTPTLWLTSSLPPLPFTTVLDTFTKTQIETVVQHLDPVLQNSNMRKIISIMPSDIADALKQFDAADYPDVISLRDMEYPQWGEPCP